MPENGVATFSKKHPPLAFGITLPMFPDPNGEEQMMVASGICCKCFQRSDLKEAIIRSLQNHGADATFRDIKLDREWMD